MLYWAPLFLIIATAATGLAYGGGVGSGAGEIMQAAFHVFLVLFFVSLVAGLARRPPRRT